MKVGGSLVAVGATVGGCVGGGVLVGGSVGTILGAKVEIPCAVEVGRRVDVAVPAARDNSPRI